MINKKLIKRQVKNAIEVNPTIIELKREEKIDLGRDDFETKEVAVATFKGFFDKSDSRVNITNEGANITRAFNFILICVKEDFKIKVGDYFYLEGIKYLVTYPKNNYNIYYECNLEAIL